MPTNEELDARLRAVEETLANVTVIRTGRPPVIKNECRKDNDPETCDAASVHQYQQGCRGLACSTANAVYYKNNRTGSKKKVQAAAEPALPPTKPKRVRKKAEGGLSPKDAALMKALENSDVGKAAKPRRVRKKAG